MQISDTDVKIAATEFLSHKGENPYRVTRRGAELWEDYAPAMRAALSALSLPVQPVAWRWKRKGAAVWIYDASLEWLSEQGDAIDKQPLYANPVPPTKGPEDDLIAALNAAKSALIDAQEELRLIRMKDTGAVYDTVLRSLTLPSAIRQADEALALRSRPASALPVVKPLEWNDDCRVFKDGSGERCCDAETVGLTGFYIIWRERDGRHTVSHSHFSVGEGFATLDDAKASAQADYERRILSALTPSVQP